MTLARLKETFFRLPNYLKLIGIGSIVLLVSTLLPWYADVDSYRIGDEFLGVTGPASFVGIVILLLSGFTLWIFSYHLVERHIPRLPVREGILNLFVAVESLFLLLLVNSMFFHPKFGVNITLKESRFGMTLAIIGSVILFVGGYLQNKEEVAKASDTGKLEPLIKLEKKPESFASQPAQTYDRPHTPIAPREHEQRPEQRPEQKRIFPARDLSKGFMFGERGAAKPEEKPSAAAPKKTDKTGEGSYMIRMDL